MRLDDQIEALATRQLSLVATWQLDGLGAQGTEIARLRRGGRWRSITRRVLALRGVGESSDRSLMAAVLDASPGAVVSHLTAAAMWGAPGFRTDLIHVTRHRGVSRRSSPLATVHEVMNLPPEHLKVMRGIPLTSPARTVFDLASCIPESRLERTVDWFWAHRLLDGIALLDVAQRLCCRGRAGSVVMRQVVEARGAAYIPPASALEGRFAQIVREHGLPEMRRQVDSGGEAWTGRVDFRDRTLPLIAEIQSELHHASLVDVAADARRRDQLERDGFVVVEVWDHEVWHQPGLVAERLLAARGALLRSLRSAG
jgi:very-short-patch-repair endonuclease